jgi:hypothetical protein
MVSDSQELSPQELEAISEIENHGMAMDSSNKELLLFTSMTDRRPSTGRPLRGLVQLRDLTDVADRLKDGLRPIDDHLGVVDPKMGYAEFAVRLLEPGVPTLYLERINWQLEHSTCAHQSEDATSDSHPDYSLHDNYGFHLSTGDGGPCIELSTATSYYTLWDGPDSLPPEARTGFKTRPTLKIFYGTPLAREDLLVRASELARNLLFELDARDNIRLGLIFRERLRSGLTRRKAGPDAVNLRYPKLRIPQEVAAIFSFAGEAADNPPYAFLSYYQALEYYLPITSRRSGIKAVRREIRTLEFDEADDGSILRLLNAVDRNRSAGEEDQLKILVAECVREDKLQDFFSENHGEHFTRKGPLVGTPAVSPKNTQELLSTQVAKRVYAIRNRIVHAKDDPRFADVPVLLPQSKEAASLGPDIRLVRLLAIETIIDGQH